ncbi:MAG: PAS domain S-box protein, partial [Polyangiaceae bacterium]|nr:PAS domain S-box protein [Polyangiaceae bacterium]
EIVANPDLWLSRLHPDDRDRVLREQSTFRPEANDAAAVARYRVIHRDGAARWVENYARAVRDDAGVPRFVLGVLLDVTEAQEADEKRARSEAKIRRLVDSNVVGIVTAELEGRILEANDAFLAMVGYAREDVASPTLSWAALTPSERAEASRRAIEQVRATGIAEPFETEYCRKDGTLAPVLVGLAGIPGPLEECVGVVLDLTERKQLEERFRHAQKLEAVGRLAGGVAHDFNNLLAVVMSYADLALTTLAPDDPLRADMGEIFKAAQRGQALTSQLLAFSRRQPREPRILDVGELACRMEETLRRLLGAAIDLQCIQAAAGRVKVDSNQMEQLLLNLVTYMAAMGPFNRRQRHWQTPHFLPIAQNKWQKSAIS